MQPPRRRISDLHVGRIDRVADWLLTYCPLSTLTLVTALLSGPPSGIAQAWPIFAGMALGDVGINLVRWRRRSKLSGVGRRGEHDHALRRRAPA